MESNAELERQDEIQVLLEHLWSLDRKNQNAEFDAVESELMDAVRENYSAAHSYYYTGAAGGPFERQKALLLSHLCAYGCSFDLIMHVHFDNERACRERQQIFQGSLPLHLACKALCDVTTITFLARQYPQGCNEEDDEMNFPLHIVLLSHPNGAELVRVLQAPRALTDLTVPWKRDGFPLDVLDALIRERAYLSIALETNSTNLSSENILFSSSRFHGFCPEIKKSSLCITVGLHLTETLTALAQCRIPLVALNIKFFDALPFGEIAEIDTLQCLFLQKGCISHDAFSELLQVLSSKPRFIRLHIRSSPTLMGLSPIQLLALTTLEVLDLGHNLIGSSLAAPLAHVLLAAHCRLRHLDVGGNNIGAEGMQRIYSALGRNKTVRTLDMVNEVGGGLVTMLKEENTTLQSINVGMAHPLRCQVDFWCRTNKYGRGRLHADGVGKDDLIDLLLEVRSRNLGTNDTVGMFYVLLGTNPVLWSNG